MCIRDRFSPFGEVGFESECVAIQPYQNQNSDERGSAESVSYTHLDVYKRQGVEIPARSKKPWLVRLTTVALPVVARYSRVSAFTSFSRR